MTAGVGNPRLPALLTLLVLVLAGCGSDSGSSGGSEAPTANPEPTAVPTVVDASCTEAITKALDLTSVLNSSYLLIREPGQIFTS